MRNIARWALTTECVMIALGDPFGRRGQSLIDVRGVRQLPLLRAG